MVERFIHPKFQVSTSASCLPREQHGEEVLRCSWVVPPRCWCCPTLLRGQSCFPGCLAALLAPTFAGVWLWGVHHPNVSPAPMQAASHCAPAAASPERLGCPQLPGLVYLLPPLINFVWVGRTSPLRLSARWRPLLHWCLKASVHKTPSLLSAQHN